MMLRSSSRPQDVWQKVARNAVPEPVHTADESKMQSDVRHAIRSDASEEQLRVIVTEGKQAGLVRLLPQTTATCCTLTCARLTGLS